LLRGRIRLGLSAKRKSVVSETQKKRERENDKTGIKDRTCNIMTERPVA
jgi:hypothetical protein